MSLKIKNFILILLISPIFISCSGKYKYTSSALKEACKYNILISSDYSKWTPKAYAYFNYCLDWYSINDDTLCDMSNDIPESNNDIEILGCWDSVYLNCSNIKSISKDINRIKKQFSSSFCKLGLSFGKNHIGVVGGELQTENDISFFYLYFLWKIENSKILILPKYIIKYHSLEKSEINDISFFTTSTFIEIGKLEKFPIAFIQTMPFDFSKIDVSETFLGSIYNINNLGYDVLRFKSNEIEEDWDNNVLKQFVQENPEYDFDELQKMSFYYNID